jgi:hypothetical protein
MTSSIINIVSATLVGEYQIRLCFDDGTTQDVDFGPFLTRSQHPEIRAYLDHARFAAFRVEHGELVWGDYDLCFPIMDLYKNRIEKHALLESAA